MKNTTHEGLRSCSEKSSLCFDSEITSNSFLSMEMGIKNNEDDFRSIIISENADERINDEVDVTIGITPQDDDTSTLAFTFRSVFLGCIWAIFLSICNILFSFRTNSFIVPTGLAQLLSYPMGVFMARVLPSGFFNPGPFTVKVNQDIIHERSMCLYLLLPDQLVDFHMELKISCCKRSI